MRSGKDKSMDVDSDDREGKEEKETHAHSPQSMAAWLERHKLSRFTERTAEQYYDDVAEIATFTQAEIDKWAERVGIQVLFLMSLASLDMIFLGAGPC